MAVRTGAQLKTDQAAVDSALVTAIATPTEANVSAVITALNTVITNGVDSLAVVKQPAGALSSYAVNNPHIPATAQIQALARDVSNIARGAKRDLLLVNRHAASISMSVPGATAADVSKELKRVQKGLENGPWASLRTTSTTD